MKNNYNSIAPFYNFISGIIFGSSLKRSQFEFLSSLPAEGKVLFMGGGNGFALQRLVKLKPHLQIIYIDQSPRMIELSKRKLGRAENKVTFIVGTEKDIPADYYDAIITFYFLDLFEIHRLHYIFYYLNSFLKKDGAWLMADFNKPKTGIQKFLSTIMFSFLRWTANAECFEIQNFNKLFMEKGYDLVQSQLFYDNFIFSSVYQKNLE